MVQYVEEEFGRLRSETPTPNPRVDEMDTSGCRTSSFFSNDQSLTDNLVGEDGDTVMEDDLQRPPGRTLQLDPTQYPRFIIAIDFGTTFSSVAVLRLENSTSAALVGPKTIQCIDHYPDMPPRGSASAFRFNPTVPTELICFAQKSNRVAETLQSDDISDQQSVGSFEEVWDDLGSENSDEEPRQPVLPSPNRGFRDSIWGWGVHCRLSSPEPLSHEMKHLTNFKLQLDDSSPGRELGKESKDKMRALKGVKTVDIITEYLSHMLRHAKERLAQMHGFHADSYVEFVLCLPTKWTDKAARVMQTALTVSIEKSRIVNLKNGAIDNLFIVAESEAAAAHVLVGEGLAAKLAAHESFLVLDCGGGTVDAVTYTLTQQEPVRLKEVVSPDGRSCGSSFLNKYFKQLLAERLEAATIIGEDSSLEQIIAAKVQDFESQKRSINLLDDRTGSMAIHIQGLQHPSKGSRQHYLDIPWKEMRDKVFKPCLRGVEELMLDQLKKAFEEGVNIQTVILIGGFAASPTLRGHLAAILRRERNLLKQRIQLLPSESVDSAVARGAILRSLQKEDGPARISRSSYGLLRNEAFDSRNAYHRKARTKFDRADGEHYLVDTIVWILDKGETVPPIYEKRVRSRHIFRPDQTELLCEETLCVSSNKHPSGYKAGHHMNKGAEVAGKIVADMTFLLTENGIPTKTSTNAQGKVFEYYEVEYDLWIIVIGRTLRFEARSPVDPNENNDFRWRWRYRSKNTRAGLYYSKVLYQPWSCIAGTGFSGSHSDIQCLQY